MILVFLTWLTRACTADIFHRCLVLVTFVLTASGDTSGARRLQEALGGSVLKRPVHVSAGEVQ